VDNRCSNSEPRTSRTLVLTDLPLHPSIYCVRYEDLPSPTRPAPDHFSRLSHENDEVIPLFHGVSTGLWMRTPRVNLRHHLANENGCKRASRATHFHRKLSACSRSVTDRSKASSLPPDLTSTCAFDESSPQASFVRRVPSATPMSPEEEKEAHLKEVRFLTTSARQRYAREP